MKTKNLHSFIFVKTPFLDSLAESSECFEPSPMNECHCPKNPVAALLWAASISRPFETNDTNQRKHRTHFLAQKLAFFSITTMYTSHASPRKQHKRHAHSVRKRKLNQAKASFRRVRIFTRALPIFPPQLTPPEWLRTGRNSLHTRRPRRYKEKQHLSRSRGVGREGKKRREEASLENGIKETRPRSAKKNQARARSCHVEKEPQGRRIT